LERLADQLASKGMSPDSAAIIGEARRITGLQDFDSDSFREGLDIITLNIATNKDLSDVGRRDICEIAIACLSNRLRVAHYARRFPEIRAKSIPKPVFVLGGPRTGTTLVSNLMAADPRRRSLLRWESLDSVPPATQSSLKTDPRCLALKESDKLFFQVSSELHHEEADGPTEDVILHAQDMKSLLWDSVSDDPIHASWILHCDKTSMYAYHRLQLQVAQHHTINSWVLKAPSNALFIHGMHQEYPDARIIWTHRDPYKALTSLCSLLAAFRAKYGRVDEKSLMPKHIEQFRLHLERPDELQESLGPGSMYNLHYTQLVSDPIGEIRKIYAWLGDELTADVEAGMTKWLSDNPQGKFGKHIYDLARFGGSLEMLRPHFEKYVEKYDVRLES
jgi:hypothetical protein